jgi:hypothetical protein
MDEYYGYSIYEILKEKSQDWAVLRTGFATLLSTQAEKFVCPNLKR